MPEDHDEVRWLTRLVAMLPRFWRDTRTRNLTCVAFHPASDKARQRKGAEVENPILGAACATVCHGRVVPAYALLCFKRLQAPSSVVPNEHERPCVVNSDDGTLE